MAEAGKLAQGYRAAPDGKRAFQLLAGSLLGESRLKDLRVLVEEHRKRYQDYNDLNYYTGELLLADRAWGEAARVLAEGRKKAPEAERQRFRSGYLLAMAHAGRACEAYGNEGNDLTAFAFLARRLAADRQWADLEALVAARRGVGGLVPEDTDLLLFAAQVRIHRAGGDGAEALIRRAYEKEKFDWLRPKYITAYVEGMKQIGKWKEGYHGAPSQEDAFELLARAFVNEKRARDLEWLCAEHARAHAADPWLLYYRGELSLLKGQAERAEPLLTQAHRLAPPR
jgi:hypothetical protein